MLYNLVFHLCKHMLALGQKTAERKGHLLVDQHVCELHQGPANSQPMHARVNGYLV